MKIIGVLLIFLIIFSYSVSAVQVVEVRKDTPNTTSEQKGFIESITSVLKSPLFWGIVVLAVIILSFLVVVFFIIRWLVSFWKKRSDLFFRLKQERLQLAEIQRSYPSKHWLKVEKNTPIRLVRKDEDGKLRISRAFAFHRGDYVTHEGNLFIAFSFPEKKKWFVLPERELLIIPNKREIKVQTKKANSDKTETIILKMPVAKDIVEFREDEILIYAESISKSGEFHFPVIKSEDGRYLDLSLPIFQTLKEVSMGDYFYEQTDAFGKVAKKHIELNPQVRVASKLGDQNQNIEATTGEDN